MEGTTVKSFGEGWKWNLCFPQSIEAGNKHLKIFFTIWYNDDKVSCFSNGGTPDADNPILPEYKMGDYRKPLFIGAYKLPELPISCLN